MKIVITDADTVTRGDLSLDAFRELGEVTVYGLTPPEQVAERVRDADIILCNKTQMNEVTLAGAARLRYIGLFATGYNNVELDYTKSKGIVVSNSPGYSTSSVAQHTFALILTLFSPVHRYHESVCKNDWIASDTFSYFPFPVYELEGKTIGIIGFGEIGQRVSAIAKSFGMNVVVYTRTRREGFDVRFVDFSELLSVSDIVTLHCPLTPKTFGMMNKNAFDKMKDGAVFINTARGAVVSEPDLRNALLSGKLSGAGIDVLETEPMREDCLLRNIPNCIITPHIAWAGLETRKRLIELVYSNLRCFLEGKPVNIVN